MTTKDAETGARAILEKRAGQAEFYVLVDNPTDCRQTISAFRKLGCKVRVELDGARLKIQPHVSE